jgi:hypothetical protein
MSIVFSSTVADNILMNKHDIKEQCRQIDSIPIVDSKNPKYIEEIAGNQLRVLKDYPAGHDFCLNIIDRAKRFEQKERKIALTDYSEDYYKVSISGKVFSEYFAECGNNDIRHNLSVQLRKDFTNGIVKISGEDKKGKYIAEKAPFKINEVKQYVDDNSTYVQLLLLKDVYGSLIDGRCLKNGGEGFSKMPANMFPLCTQTNKRNFQSFNPIYRLQVYGLSKNTHKCEVIKQPRKDLLRSIVPEYTDENGWLMKITIKELNESLKSQATSLIQNIQGELLVKSFYLGQYGRDSVIYFTAVNKNTKNSENAVSNKKSDA